MWSTVASHPGVAHLWGKSVTYVPILGRNVTLGFDHCLRHECQAIQGRTDEIYEAFVRNYHDIETETRLEKWLNG